MGHRIGDYVRCTRKAMHGQRNLEDKRGIVLEIGQRYFVVFELDDTTTLANVVKGCELVGITDEMPSYHLSHVAIQYFKETRKSA